MKTKKTIGIIAVAVMGLTAATWAVDAATEPAQNNNGTGYAQCAYDNGGCGHWYRWLPGHRNRCGWNNCGNQSQSQNRSGGCCW